MSPLPRSLVIAFAIACCCCCRGAAGALMPSIVDGGTAGLFQDDAWDDAWDQMHRDIPPPGRLSAQIWHAIHVPSPNRRDPEATKTGGTARETGDGGWSHGGERWRRLASLVAQRVLRHGVAVIDGFLRPVPSRKRNIPRSFSLAFTLQLPIAPLDPPPYLPSRPTRHQEARSAADAARGL